MARGGQQDAMVRSRNEKVETLKGLFERQKGAIAALLPKHLPPEKLVKIVLSAASRTPTLLECDPTSILLASMQSAALGLEPNTPLQQAFLVPYWNNKTKRKEAQFIPGYRGLIQLAVQSGEIKSVQARAVYENDPVFVVRLGIDETIEHVPLLTGNRGKLIAVYSIAKFANGAVTFEVMSVDDVNKIKAGVKKPEFGPWVWDEHFDEMAKKTVIRRHSKVMPMSSEKLGAFQRALDAQAHAEEGTNSYGDIADALPGVDEPPQLGNGSASRGDDLDAKLQASVDATAPKDEREPGSDG